MARRVGRVSPAVSMLILLLGALGKSGLRPSAPFLNPPHAYQQLGEYLYSLLAYNSSPKLSHFFLSSECWSIVDACAIALFISWKKFSLAAKSTCFRPQCQWNHWLTSHHSSPKNSHQTFENSRLHARTHTHSHACIRHVHGEHFAIEATSLKSGYFLLS